MDDIIILIPALNPNEKLLKLVTDLKTEGFYNIVVVNDGSGPEFQSIFYELQNRAVNVVTHCVNLGKGRALKTGINFIENHFPGCKGIITVDADGQHNIEDVRRCAQKLDEIYKERKIIIGCRVREDSQVKIPLRSRFGNACTRFVLRYLCNLHVSDSQCGLRAIPENLLARLMKISGEGYEFETNILLELANEGVETEEIPISMIYENDNTASHFNPVWDSIRIYSVILKYSFASLLSAGLDYLAFALMAPHCSNIFALTFFGRAISACVNFTLNKRMVFKSQDPVVMQAVQYICLVLLSGSISAFCIQTVFNISNWDLLLIKIIVESILYFVNFYIQKNFIFSKSKKGTNRDA